MGRLDAMAWDTEVTQRKLLDAGARQFAAHGFAGARMETIGRDAGVNKERVYSYFGDKRGFFAAVLSDQLDSLLEDVPVRGTGPDAVGGFAGRLFDYYQARPLIARLLAWESLELSEPVAVERRTALCQDRAAAIGAALHGVDAECGSDVLLSVLTLVTGWWTLSGLTAVVLDADAGDASRRATIVAQARQLATLRASAPA